MMAAALGICAAGTAPAGVFLLERDRRIARSDLRALKFFSAVDDLPAILALGGVVLPVCRCLLSRVAACLAVSLLA